MRNTLFKKFFIDNERIRISWVQEKLKNLENEWTILDAWAWEMQYKHFCSHLIYTSQDFNQYDGKWDWVGCQMWSWQQKTDITSDIIDIPVADGSFDNILCTEVLEHIPHPDRAIEEFARIIRPGGYLILTAPFCSLTHFSPYYFANGFSEYWYRNILVKYWFEIIELRKNWNYFQYIEQENLRIPYMAKKYCESNFFMVWMFMFVSFIQILILKYLAKIDQWSSEMLNFWTHVLAIKK